MLPSGFGNLLHIVAPVAEPGFWQKFLEFKLSDAISTLSVVVALLVYLYQRRKDARDAKQQGLEAARTARQQWVWLMLLEPNRDYILSFFTRLEHALLPMNHPQVRLEERTQTRLAVENLLNEFERRFLTYFDSIDPLLAAENEDLFDTLRTDLTQGLSAFTGADYFVEHKQLVGLVLAGRSSFLSKLYAFSFATA